MGQIRCESLLQKLNKIVPKYVAQFIIWHYTPEDKRCPFEKLMTYEPNFRNKTLDDAMEWLTREDAQIAMQMYHKHMKTYNLIKLYETMLSKAMTGDVNAAKWVESFSNSAFFDESQDEMDSFLTGVNIPALKGGGGNGSK